MASLVATVSKESACSAGDPVQSPVREDPLEKEMGNLLQYSCLENSRDIGALRGIVHGITRVGNDLATKPPSHSTQHFININSVKVTKALMKQTTLCLLMDVETKTHRV